MKEISKELPIDIYPNKNRMIRALDIYTTAMRDVAIGQLKGISTESLTIKELMCASLPQKLFEKDIRPLRSERDIHAALEEKHFPYLLKNNWDACFRPRFGIEKNMVCNNAAKLVKLRNRLAHWKNGDSDEKYTLRHLNEIVDILQIFERVDEKSSVEMIRNELTITTDAVQGTVEGDSQLTGDESEATDHGGESLEVCKQSAPAEPPGRLAVKPIKDLYSLELGDVSYENGESWTAWLVGDETWCVHTTKTSIVAKRVEGTRVDVIRAIEEDITQLLFAENYASDDEEQLYHTEDGDWIDLHSIEVEIKELERCKAELLPGLFHLPSTKTVSSDDEYRNGQEAPMSIYPVGDATRLGTDATTGESFWKVSDSYWCSTERRHETTAEKLDEEAIRRSRLITKFIPE